ncbi:hypothetical protein QM012_002973 [Aureobasidium pullulans]|uniref:Uncharacterized protein n=1 Tax=Aureobasidium pullulans TaxID=5580 RepID=A0ABR0TA85_AURPU
MKRAKDDHPGDNVAALQDYNDWNQTQFRRFNSSVQAEWMDWVANGHKYDVEYRFGVVDVDSIMARIELSKESMRNSAIIDVDGANEVQEVQLTPKEWSKPVPVFTLEQITTEINRLTRLKASYQALQDATKDGYPGAPPVTAEEKKEVDSDVAEALAALLKAQTALARSPADKGLETTVNEKRLALSTAQQAQSRTDDALNKFNMANGDEANQKATAAWLAVQTATGDNQLQQLNDKRDALLQTRPSTIPVVIGAHAEGDKRVGDGGTGTDLAAPDAKYANPIFGTSGDPTSKSDGSASKPTTDNPWTDMSFSFSAQGQQKASDESSWGMSVGGGVGWGLWSAGGSYSHDQSSSQMQLDMSSCDVNISFQALVVNINRPWLHAELFSDTELDTPADVFLSPGAEQLKDWIAKPKQSISKLAQFNMFPAYPTSFIIAANTVIVFHGDTQHIEQHMSSESNSGSTSVGFGPWSVSSSFHQSSTH